MRKVLKKGKRGNKKENDLGGIKAVTRIKTTGQCEEFA
jgi:hypothetical protein